MALSSSFSSTKALLAGRTRPAAASFAEWKVNKSFMAHTELQTEDIDSISERLKAIPLKLPRSLGEHPDTEAKALYLRNLLRHDPGVFLERHGTDLNSEERALFEPLRPDSFEVDFYMRQLENDNSGIRALTPAVVRNRRLAKLNRLSADDFFSEVCRLMVFVTCRKSWK